MFKFLAVLLIALLAFSTAQPENRVPERRIRGDVDSVFFSPFRIIGKRSQVYGLYENLGNPNPYY